MGSASTSSPLEFLLNGRRVGVDVADFYTTLLDFVRRRGLTGAKEGCAEGECGACAVALVAGRGPRSTFRIVNSCLLPAAVVADHEIYTIESLAVEGQLAPAQKVMAAAGGSQCGYCTPGFVMSLFAEQYRPDRDGPCDPLALAGNLCRCTGYRPIRDAALALSAPPPGAFRDRLAEPAPAIGRHVTPGFSRPTTLNECLSILAADPEATLIAGGSDLGVDANLKGRRFRHLVSLEAVEELLDVSEGRTSVTLGAALPLTDIGERWAGAPRAVRNWLSLFASPSIRNRATLGGNLATASPIGDAAPLLLALDAIVHVAGRDGHRTVPLSSFFVGYRQTVLAAGELIAAVEVPTPLPEVLSFYKVAKRRMDDISTVAAAMAIDRDGRGYVSRARFAFGGVAATPVRAEEAEAAVVGQLWNEAAVRRVQRILGRTLAPMSDHRGSREYRLEVSKSLVEKFWAERPS